MQNRNPYAAPQTQRGARRQRVEDYGEIRIFSRERAVSAGVRYIGYSMGLGC